MTDILSYDEFIKGRKRYESKRELEAIDDFFDNDENCDGVTIDVFIGFLKKIKEDHKDKDLRVKQDSWYSSNKTYITYTVYESDKDYTQRMTKSYNTYVENQSAKMIKMAVDPADKIKALEVEIARLRTLIGTNE
jgi:hypothetical protein